MCIRDSFYTVLTLSIVAIGLFPTNYTIAKWIYEKRKVTVKQAPYLLAECISTGLLIMLGLFFSFHIRILLQNTTTIETLEKQRSGTVKSYDCGPYNNFIQVFGKNPWLWLLPMHGETGKPVGDGVEWSDLKQKLSGEIKEEELKPPRGVPNKAAGSQKIEVNVFKPGKSADAPGYIKVVDNSVRLPAPQK
eukprot:TRINITY_DN5816_c0_g1_i8.p1 TRINITY_DN5816_c0_g1~~TRINITY_DN5816_c0_g1_i8.p1  ORF type:complete len:191 (-),score=31.52 TRINITY_DN5816_c0_g1_i8:486-1058(-)